MNSKLILLAIFACLVIFSCKEKNADPLPDTVSGSYTLSSVVSNKGLDPEQDGTFGDTELFDNLPCLSEIVIDETNEVTFRKLDLFQSVTKDQGGAVISYGELMCVSFSTIYASTLTNNSLTLTAQTGTKVLNVISNSELEYITTEDFPVEENGIVEQVQVQLTLKYTK